jgi:hypothetical protein
MAIEEIEIEVLEVRVPDNVARLIETCSRGWERFFADDDDQQAPKFVPSVPEIVFSALAEVTQRNLPPNRVFCEWGSGFGTATCMAALLGYKAYGIEIEEELVRLSRAIARRLGIRAEILCTSMFPKGYDSRVNHSPLRYDGMDCDIDEIGLFFVYPWADERELMQELFDAVAATGAILVAYYTDRNVCAFRKV